MKTLPVQSQAAIDYRLTEKQKEYVYMYYFQGYTMTQIAEIKQINKSSVSRAIASADRKLTKLNVFLTKYNKEANA